MKEITVANKAGADVKVWPNAGYRPARWEAYCTGCQTSLGEVMTEKPDALKAADEHAKICAFA